jgi:deoxycytidylate deaminase
MKRKMGKLTIYVVRKKYDCAETHSISAPCCNCTKKIKEIGIKKIVYVDINGNITKCLSKNYSTEFISSGYRRFAKKNVSTD